MSMDISLIKHGNEAELKLNGYIDAGNAAEAERSSSTWRASSTS